MAKDIIKLAASVRARLLRLSKATGQTFDLVLTRFALERLLYRLSNSKHAERVALKGAMLLTTWFEDPTRPTRDIDLLGFGDADSEAMLQTFREIIQVAAADGMIFEPDSWRTDRIREDDLYGGVRLRTKAGLAGAGSRGVLSHGLGASAGQGVGEGSGK